MWQAPQIGGGRFRIASVATAWEMLCIHESCQRPSAPSQERLSTPPCHLHIIRLLKLHEPVQAVELSRESTNATRIDVSSTTLSLIQPLAVFQGISADRDQPRPFIQLYRGHNTHSRQRLIFQLVQKVLAARRRHLS